MAMSDKASTVRNWTATVERGLAKIGSLRTGSRQRLVLRMMKSSHHLPMLAVAVFATVLNARIRAGEEPFVPLFDGRTLDGWEQHSGKAEYRVEDGAIIGKTVVNTENSFLCTKKKYRDFILEFEFKVAPAMNSGVQFRSEFYKDETTVEINGKPRKFPADRVFGYQYEIDPSARAFTGGVYDEARRGWLADLKNNEQARKAFMPEIWNAGRIECRGDSIKTWINASLAADFKDSMTKEGFIALQVHGIGNKTEKAGEEVRWRNLRIKELK
jgi:hypothetical protein